MRNILVVALFLVPVAYGFCLTDDTDTLKTGNNVLYEKVYLHIDRELYTPGDNIWFKSYLVSGINHKLIPGYKNLYVQLIAEDGAIADQKLLLSVNGQGKGDFHLSDSLPEGEYTIRAYTKYLRNFGEQSYFKKKIAVTPAKSSLDLVDPVPESKNIDVSFLPEGGNFILNAVNHVAFKAIDESGKGIAVTGKVVDETGQEVVSFRTRYKGMGKFIIMPQEGKSYFARIEGFPDAIYPLEPAREQGIGLNYKTEGAYLVFTLNRNLKVNFLQKFLLVASHKGTELFSSQIDMNAFQHEVRLYKGLFPPGISQITIYNTKAEKLAERLVFVYNQNDPAIDIFPAKEVYRNREKIEIDMISLLPENDSILSTVSVSVVDEDYFSVSGNSQTIESYLLMDSELKGSIESPASLFVDQPGIPSEEKLDLVMMVNGWRSYYWNELENFAGQNLPGWADYGLQFDGYVNKTWGGKPVDDGKVVLGPYSQLFLTEEVTTDSHGRFGFERLYLKDSALIMIQAETKNGNRRTEIMLEQPLAFDSAVQVSSLNSFSPGFQVPLNFYRSIYFRQLADQEFEKELGTLLLDDVNIEGKLTPRIEDHFRLYGEPDHSFAITPDDWTYASIADFLQTRVPGVIVTGDEIRIRAGYGNPLLLVDGLEVEWDYIKHLPLGDVDKIEILKNSALIVTYGSRGGNGVISILTRIGRGIIDNDFVREAPGRITPRVTGFHQPRIFYSPKYSSDNINDPKPDFRPTLYWNPEVEFNGTKAKLEFFASDKKTRYYIHVEGISKNGKIICGTAMLTVSDSAR